MDLKRFKKGQTAYVVDLNVGSSKQAEYQPVTVISVGRKYVTTNTGWKFEEDIKGDPNLPLKSNCSYGWRTYLVPTEDEAKEIVKKQELLLWLRKNFLNSIDNLPLEQLRTIKNICTGFQKEEDNETEKI